MLLLMVCVGQIAELSVISCEMMTQSSSSENQSSSENTRQTMDHSTHNFSTDTTFHSDKMNHDCCDSSKDCSLMNCFLAPVGAAILDHQLRVDELKASFLLIQFALLSLLQPFSTPLFRPPIR